MDTLHQEMTSWSRSQTDNEILQWCADDFFAIHARVVGKRLPKAEWKAAWRELRAAAAMVRKSIVFSD